ncbi:MAG: hypothetical protein V4469_02340 [Patescibacteria group bacterium]
MNPTDDAYVYFYIIFTGFITVWSYRKTVNLDKKLSEFEYIGFSAFWGIALIAAYGGLEKLDPRLSNLLTNPFASGLCLSVLGMGVAFFAGRLVILAKDIHEKGWAQILKLKK